MASMLKHPTTTTTWSSSTHQILAGNALPIKLQKGYVTVKIAKGFFSSVIPVEAGMREGKGKV